MCTAAQHVLAVPELLRLVFLCIADDELESVAHALRVCKFWWEVGKEILYREVDVENVLCGVQDVAVYPEDTACSSYVTPLEFAGVVRLQSYGKHIKSLNMLEGRRCQPLIDAIALVRGSIEVFPNVAFLDDCYLDLGRLLLFVSPKFKSLALERQSSKDFTPLLRHLAIRAPALRTLRLTAAEWDDDAEFIETLKDLSRREVLSNLTLMTSPTFQWYKLLHVLSFARLDRIFLTVRRGSFTNLHTTTGITHGAFKDLNYLYLAVTARQLLVFLSESDTALPLKTLQVISTGASEPCSVSELCKLCTALGSTCSYLSCLRLDVRGSKDDTYLRLVDAQQDTIVTMESLRPLLACKALESVVLGHPLPFGLSFGDLYEMARAWPNVHSLILNPSPLRFQHAQGHPMSAIHMFARECPKLSHLGLYLDGTSPNIFSPIDGKPFTNLEYLHVGYSDVTLLGGAPATLATSLSPRCKVVPGTWSSHVLIGEYSDSIQATLIDRETHWDIINRTVVPNLRRLMSVESSLDREQADAILESRYATRRSA